MRTFVLLISEDKVKNYTDMDNNIDVAFITNALREAQDIRLQKILSQPLYERIQAGYRDNDLNAQEQTLLYDYIDGALIYWTYYYMLDAIMLRTKQGGLVVGEAGDFSRDVTMDAYDRKRKGVEAKAVFYTDLLQRYLIANKADFPQYTEVVDFDQIAADFSKQSTSGFVLDNDYPHMYNRYGIPVYNTKYPHLPQ